MKPEQRDGASNELSIERGGDQDCDAVVAEAVCADEQRAVPKCEDGRAGNIDSDLGTGSRDITVAKRSAECADDKRGERRDGCEQDSLLARENVHEDEFSRESAAQVFSK